MSRLAASGVALSEAATGCESRPPRSGSSACARTESSPSEAIAASIADAGSKKAVASVSSGSASMRSVYSSFAERLARRRIDRDLERRLGADHQGLVVDHPGGGAAAELEYWVSW